MNINFENLVNQVKPRGVIHVGANTCQELPLYLAHGIEHRIWIEPNEKLSFPKGEYIINVAIGETDAVSFNTYVSSNNGESTSYLKPLKHLQVYEEISFTKKSITTAICTLETLMFELGNGKHRDELNYLVLDIQGMELGALKGLGDFNNHFDVIITEAYTEELYQNCGKLQEIEAFLSNYKLVEFAEEVGKGWGDAAFIRKDLLK
jgi:hypothetical protein